MKHILTSVMNKVFDEGTKDMFRLPESYEMLAQMPFGSIEQGTGDKEHIDSLKNHLKL